MLIDKLKRVGPKKAKARKTQKGLLLGCTWLK